jgi:hypothetical protein
MTGAYALPALQWKPESYHIQVNFITNIMRNGQRNAQAFNLLIYLFLPYMLRAFS